jgi:hypothetical protein
VLLVGWISEYLFSSSRLPSLVSFFLFFPFPFVLGRAPRMRFIPLVIHNVAGTDADMLLSLQASGPREDGERAGDDADV